MIPERVRSALALVEMNGYEKRSPHTLSGGKNNGWFWPGVGARAGDHHFDEATAMLDPTGRQEVINIMQKLHRAGKTIIAITHYVEEAVAADKVILMHQGRVLACGRPQAILTNLELMQVAELIPPLPVRLYYDLQQAGIQLNRCPLTNEELAEAICQFRSNT